jgi:superfamily II DNA helicase RecQ
MQIKLFTIPVGDSGGALQEMNAFLRGNKILEVENKLMGNENGAYWCFCVRYIERAYPEAGSEKEAKKVDYKKLLDEVTFEKFSKLREIRKKVAADEGISAFIVFGDEELAELAKLDEITEKAMLGIKGIGEKKVERFAKHFTTQPKTDETTGIPD